MTRQQSRRLAKMARRRLDVPKPSRDPLGLMEASTVGPGRGLPVVARIAVRGAFHISNFGPRGPLLRAVPPEDHVGAPTDGSLPAASTAAWSTLVPTAPENNARSHRFSRPASHSERGASASWQTASSREQPDGQSAPSCSDATADCACWDAGREVTSATPCSQDPGPATSSAETNSIRNSSRASSSTCRESGRSRDSSTTVTFMPWKLIRISPPASTDTESSTASTPSVSTTSRQGAFFPGFDEPGASHRQSTSAASLGGRSAGQSLPSAPPAGWCSDCGEAMQSWEDFVRHFKTRHLPAGVQVCRLCLQSADDEGVHARKHQFVVVKCNICPARFLHVKLLKTHKASFHRVRSASRLTTDLSGGGSDSDGDRRRGSGDGCGSAEPSRRQGRCGLWVCRAPFESWASNVEHFREKHVGQKQKPSLFCQLCLVYCYTACSLSRHLAKHERLAADGKFFCSMCGAHFLKRKRLGVHATEVHGVSGTKTH